MLNCVHNARRNTQYAIRICLLILIGWWLLPAIADARDWRSVRDGVEAKLCRGPDGTETFLLCRSADRRK